MREIIISPFIFLIKIYQVVISPAIGSNCRFNPTCSNYAKESLKNMDSLKDCIFRLLGYQNVIPGEKVVMTPFHNFY